MNRTVLLGDSGVTLYAVFGVVSKNNQGADRVAVGPATERWHTGGRRC
jgi:hypothetical protein